jgi:glycosyltransferase involved in cell wall biosynthesis
VAQDVKHFYPQAVDPIVTGEGIPMLPRPCGSALPYRPYLFYVGSAYPHKRLDLLFGAWKTLSGRYPELHLVIGGKHDAFLRRLMDQAAHDRLPRVVFPGIVSDLELATLYAQAEAFVFPSSHEGFGLPPLEALSHSCPVISSDATCLPEVLPHEGVFFFRSGDQDDMIRATDAVLGDLISARAQALRGREEVVAKYHWDRVAERTLAAYERVLHVHS